MKEINEIVVFIVMVLVGAAQIMAIIAQRKLERVRAADARTLAAWREDMLRKKAWVAEHPNGNRVLCEVPSEVRFIEIHVRPPEEPAVPRADPSRVN